MAGFFAQVGTEFLARRRRLRLAIEDRRASLLEFALLAGLVLGATSGGFGPKGFIGGVYGPFLPVLAVIGYFVLDAQRQRALAAGQPAPDVTAAFDRRVLWFIAAVAAIGYATFVWATLAPAPFELVPEEVPAGALPVTIGP
ncbi:MAG: hypothetical protein NW200_08785 [Hyphomonadaceae bacterium]|nr:hypothetical protein [Hyphomonadaceae bacterium]